MELSPASVRDALTELTTALGVGGRVPVDPSGYVGHA